MHVYIYIRSAFNGWFFPQTIEVATLYRKNTINAYYMISYCIDCMISKLKKIYIIW